MSAGPHPCRKNSLREPGCKLDKGCLKVNLWGRYSLMVAVALGPFGFQQVIFKFVKIIPADEATVVEI